VSLVVSSSSSSSATPALVQQAHPLSTCKWASGTTYNCVFSNTPSASNIQIYTGGSEFGGQYITGISSTNMIWTKIAQIPYSETASEAEAWCAVSSGGGTPGTTVTVTFSGTPAASYGNISEWSGTSGCTLDGSAKTGGCIACGTITSPSVTTSQAVDLVIAVAYTSSSKYSAGPTNGFTELLSAATNSNNLAAYLVTSSSGTYNTAWTDTSSASTLIFAIK
jgi:hypothetical protein